MQDLNNQLVEKVKSLEAKLEVSEAEKQRIKKKKNKSFSKRSMENSELEDKLQEVSKKRQALRVKYEALVESSLSFEEKTRDLYRVNQLLHENIINLVPEFQL